jgi:hypothetical protein
MADLNARGFILDSPNALIMTTNGDYQSITAQSGEVSFTGDTIKINGGWGYAPLTELDNSKGLDVTLTDAMMQFDMLKLTSGGTVSQGAVEFYEFGNKYTIGSAATPTITIPAVVVAGSVRVNGFTETQSTPTDTSFLVTIGSTDTTVTFTSTNAATDVYPAYKILTETTAIQLSVTTESFAKSGECVLKFPIYASPDSDSADIAAYGNLHLYKVKIKTANTLGGSYKSPSTFKIDMTSLDPQRADKKWWDFTYNSIV